MERPGIDSRYLEAREMALAANAIRGASSCVSEGACCTARVPITPDDIKIITGDISEGKIPKETIDAAIARFGASEEQDRCPFLTDVNRCSIYDSRPYVCISWGIGGEPIASAEEYSKLAQSWKQITESDEQIPDNYQKAARGWKREGTPSTVPNLAITQATCQMCRFETAWNGTPIEANEKIRAANRLIYGKVSPASGKRDQLITDFVREDLMVKEDLPVIDSTGLSRQVKRQLERKAKKKEKRALK